ncbi:hypothetical protein RDWZM_007236 [Blomia tropicalis]|uniref:BZIP domain-containing protein n=1 Tax=Blomia tropicalis TaxID=40697 RepID=A0A9Q0RP44_BLOTA|nr:hypothetical protein RDWZM_007236 [Blomia tropicalis]
METNQDLMSILDFDIYSCPTPSIHDYIENQLQLNGLLNNDPQLNGTSNLLNNDPQLNGTSNLLNNDETMQLLAPSTSTLTPFIDSDTLINATNLDNQTITLPNYEGNDPVQYSSFSDNSERGSKNRNKCMNKNAVLARQNREKKKIEFHELKTRNQQLEEEITMMKKRFNENKLKCDQLVERNKYLEAIVDNIPQIKRMVEHMNTHMNENDSYNDS